MKARTLGLANTIKNNKTLTAIIGLWFLVAAVLPVNIVAKTFFIAAGLNFYVFTIYFGNFFNLASLFMTMFLFMIGCSQTKATPIEQDDFSLMTWLTLFAVILCFYATVFIFLKLKKTKIKPQKPVAETFFNNRTILLVNLLFLIVEPIVYVVMYQKLGGIPLFDDYLRANVMPVVINNWLMTFMVLPAMLVVFDVVHIVKTSKYWYFSFVVVFLTLVMSLGGRISIFIPIVTAVFYMLMELYFTKQKRGRLFVITGVLVGIMVVLMVVIPLVRTSVYSDSGLNYYDTIYEDVNVDGEKPNTTPPGQDEWEIPSALKPLWVNFSTEMHGFNWMVQKLSATGSYQYGRMLLLGPFNFVCKYFIAAPKVNVLRYDWLNVLSFMQKPYMDFGIVGVAFFITLYTAIGMYAYSRTIEKRSLLSRLFYAYYCMSTLFMIFENHFYYTTYVVNTVLLVLFAWAFCVDWVAVAGKVFGRLPKSKKST